MAHRSATFAPEKRALDVLVGVLPVAAEVNGPRRHPDADVMVGGMSIQLRWLGEGTLGDARRALASWGKRRPDVVVARHLSPGARELLSASGVGWADETGAAEIALGSVIVSRTGRPSARPDQRGRWTPATAAVAEALLCGVKATVAATQEATGLSTGACTNALRTLTDLGLLEAPAARGRGSGRRIADPDRLLDGFRRADEIMGARVSLQVGVAWRDVVDNLRAVGRKWDAANIEWAATGPVAAAILGPYLATVTTADVYIDATTPVGLEAAARNAGLRPIDGGRLTLRPFPTIADSRLAQRADKVRVAPWPRVYVDLAASGVRGEEAAEHLLEVVRAP